MTSSLLLRAEFPLKEDRHLSITWHWLYIASFRFSSDICWGFPESCWERIMLIKKDME